MKFNYLNHCFVHHQRGGGVSGTLCSLGGGIDFSVEEGVSDIKFTMESLESESMTITSHDTFNFSLGSVFILDVSMGGGGHLCF